MNSRYSLHPFTNNTRDMTRKYNNAIGTKSITMLVLYLGILAFEKSHAQESVNSSGGDASGSGGSVAYSIG
jgi:hypothetical protein